MTITSIVRLYVIYAHLGHHLGSRCSCDVELPIAVKVSVRLEVAKTGYTSIVNINIVDSNVLAAARSTQDVVVPTLLCCGTGDVSHNNIGDQNASSRVAGWTAVQVVLLDVDTVNRNVLYTDVLEKDVVNVSSGVLISLDARTVLGVQNDRVAEHHVGDVVVRLAADRANGEPVAAITVHVVDHDVVTAGDGDTVVLVDDNAVANLSVVGRGKVEAIAVVRGGKAIGAVVRCVAGAVVQSDVIDV